MDGYASAHAVQLASWIRWQRDVFSLWIARLPVWLSLGLLAGSLLHGLSLLMSGAGPVLSYASTLLIGTLFTIVYVHTAFQHAHRERVESHGLLTALRAFLPVLLLQVLDTLLRFIMLGLGMLLLLRVFGPLLLTTIVGGLVLLIPWLIATILVGTIMLLTVPIIIAEHVGPFTALARWWAMLPGNILPVLLLLLLLFTPLALILISTLIIQPTSMVAQYIISGVYYLVIIPWVHIAAVVVYRDLRQKKPFAETDYPK